MLAGYLGYLCWTYRMLSSNGIHSYVGDLLYRLSKRTRGPIVLPPVLLINEKAKVEGILQVGKALRLNHLDWGGETGGRDMKLACTSVSGDSERNKSQKRHFYRKTVANSFNKYRLKEQWQVTARLTTVTCVYRSAKLLKFTLELDPQCLNLTLQKEVLS